MFMVFIIRFPGTTAKAAAAAGAVAVAADAALEVPAAAAEEEEAEADGIGLPGAGGATEQILQILNVPQSIVHKMS